MFIEALFTIAKIWKHPKCTSINHWTKNKWYIHTVGYSWPLKRIMGYYLAICSNMGELKGIMLSVICQTDKEKYHMISLVCGI